ncbi:hypothetical protein [Paraburkholderia guartelaensis]|uniref:Transposase n=1 Tax=Paraburkholderia guartelaensis TaxID=2546446 RepID=A0ABU9SMZ5_9BURK
MSAPTAIKGQTGIAVIAQIHCRAQGRKNWILHAMQNEYHDIINCQPH